MKVKMEAKLKEAISGLLATHKAHLVEPSLEDVAEACFKAGMQEVVEVVKAELVASDSRNMWYLNKTYWQAQLKKWGIGR